MNFLKKRGRAFLTILLPILFVVQQVGVWYGRSYRSQMEDKDKYNHIVALEIKRLKEEWHKVIAADPLTPEKLANRAELEISRSCLEEANNEILKSLDRFEKAVKNKDAAFQQVYTYYHENILALTAIVDFLLAKHGEYTIHENAIDFTSASDGEAFQNLVAQLNDAIAGLNL